MKAGVMTEIVYQRVMAGKPNVDSAVKRIDIKAYLPAAINYALTQQYYVNVQSEGDYDALPKTFISTYEDVAVKYSPSRDKRYIELPAQAVPMPFDSGIEAISAMQGDVKFQRLRNQFELSGYERFMSGTTFYWLEGQKAYFVNISPLVKEVLVRMLSSIDSVSDDDEVPVPMGMEVQVIDLMVQHFLGTRFGGQDDKQDNVESVKAGQ